MSNTPEHRDKPGAQPTEWPGAMVCERVGPILERFRNPPDAPTRAA